MEIKVQVTFQQILKLVRALNPSQKSKLLQDLEGNKGSPLKHGDEFFEYLLKGPVYTQKDISTIQNNRIGKF